MLRLTLRNGGCMHRSRQKLAFSVKKSLLAGYFIHPNNSACNSHIGEKHSAWGIRKYHYIQNEGQNVGHLPKVPEIFATQVRMFSVQKETQSESDNQGIKIFSNVSSNRVGVTRWINRPQVEEQILANFRKNEGSYLIRSTRFNDYAGLIISGGIGSGKTRTGQEIPNIIAPLAQRLEYFAVYHFMINLHKKELLSVKGYKNSTVRPANVTKINTRIGRWFMRRFAEVIGIEPSGMDLQRLVYTLQQRDQLPPDKKIVLYLHVDEFQEAPYLCLGLTRYLSDFISPRTPEHSQWFDNLVVIPVFTGTAPSAFLQSIWKKTSSYGIQLVQLKNDTSPAWLHGLSDKFIELIPENRRGLVNMVKKEAQHQYEQLLISTGGIPKFIQSVVLEFASADSSVGPVQTIGWVFNQTVNELYNLYPPTRYNSWFGDPSHLKKFLRLAFFNVPVTRQTQINGQTIGELELAGFIYLTPVDGTYLYTISCPLLVMHYLERFAGINMLSNRQLLKQPFNIINENDFATLIAEIYAFSIELLAHEGVGNTTVRELHRGCITGPESLLSQSLSFQHVEKFVSVDEMQPIDDQSGSTTKAKLIGRKGQIDLLDTSKTLVIKTMPRYPGPDLILPGKLQVQLKWSLYITSMMPVPSEASDTTVISLKLIQREANKSNPDLPLIIITPKRADPKLLASITDDSSLSNIGLITDGDCRAFLLPFYLHPTK